MFKETVKKWVLILISLINKKEEDPTPQKAEDWKHCAEDLRSNWEYKKSCGQRAIPWDKKHLVKIVIGRGNVMHYCTVCDNAMVDLDKRVLLQEDIDRVIFPLPAQSEFGPEGHLVWAHWHCMYQYKESLKSSWSFEMNVKLQVTLDSHTKFQFEDQAFNNAKREVQRRLQEYGIHGIDVSITEVNKISGKTLDKNHQKRNER